MNRAGRRSFSEQHFVGSDSLAVDIDHVAKTEPAGYVGNQAKDSSNRSNLEVVDSRRRRQGLGVDSISRL